MLICVEQASFFDEIIISLYSFNFLLGFVHPINDHCIKLLLPLEVLLSLSNLSFVFGLGALFSSACRLWPYLALPSLIKLCYFPSFFPFYYYFILSPLGSAFELAYFFPYWFFPGWLYFTVSLASFLSFALLSFFASFYWALGSFGLSFLSVPFLSSFFYYFFSLPFCYCFSPALESFVNFSIDPLPSFFGSSFTFFWSLPVAEYAYQYLFYPQLWVTLFWVHLWVIFF